MTVTSERPDSTRATASPPIWRNWSGNVVCQPQAFARPLSEDALRDLLRQSQGPLRVRGAGHSFTRLCDTAGTLVALDALPGNVISVDRARPTARLQAGASLNSLSRALQAEGLAFKNLGDIDVQSLAGAVATATHGTGATLPCLSAEIRSVRLMTAAGEIVEADAETDADLLKAARVSLGVLGVLLEAEVSVRPAFKLHRIARVEPLQDLLGAALSLWDENRHFEFFVLPHCDHAVSITHNETDAADRTTGKGDDEAALRQLRWVRNSLLKLPGLRRHVLNAALRGTRTEDAVGDSWAVLASVRNTAFNEMEYHLPVARGLETLEEVLALIERDRPEVFFPIEVRMTAGDDAWLSPFQHGPRLSIAVHSHAPDDHAWMQALVEPIFRRRGGRPHWGKLHSLSATDLRDLYPDFDRFCATRRQLDPAGRFLNPHLAALFGTGPA
jgi:FAD-linked oxidoreductase